ncbi:MAG: HAD family hydrolase [Acidobacteriota bacterium]
MDQIRYIAFDADDTLWHNERIFTETQEKFRKLLGEYRDQEWINRKIYATEKRNLQFFGYGIKGFTLSMIETAIELTEGHITGSEVRQIIGFAKEMLKRPVQLLDHVQATLERVFRTHELILVTKGDLFDQESKILSSGLGEYFSHIEIVSEKNETVYRRILAEQGIDPRQFLMVGNSLRSDILPVLTIGGNAVYIPYFTTWEHEKVEAKQGGGRDFVQLEHIGLLPDLFEGQ